MKKGPRKLRKLSNQRLINKNVLFPKIIEGKMFPLMTDLDVAPKSLLQVVRCKCKIGCGKRCGCKRLSIECTPACSECRGICQNMKLENTEETADDDRVAL